MRALVQFSGDEQAPRRRYMDTKPLERRASQLFRLGKRDTAEIASILDASEARVLKRVTLERCKRLGLPDPYEADE